MRLAAWTVVLCVLVGCQAPASAPVVPTEAPVVAPASDAVWGEVPKQCA